MSIGINIFRRLPVIEAVLRALIEEEVVEAIQEAEASVARGMRSKGMTPDKRSLKDCTRDALFRLIRKVIPSGDLADAIRDRLDDQVVALVTARFPGTPTLEALVTATREITLQVIEDLVG